MKSRRIYAAYVALLVLAALGVLEGAARRQSTATGAKIGEGYPWLRKGARVYTVDPEFGFRPILGGSLYTEDGVHPHGYSREKRPGAERVLFLGDSVTARGKILEALRSLYGDEAYEYWNGGVESFNTVQEARYYERFHGGIDADQVILTFTMNDFLVTPVAFVDAKGDLVVYSPLRRISMNRLERFLYRKSALYRQALSHSWNDARNETLLAADVDGALGKIQTLAASRGARLTVLVQPALRPLDEWQPGEEAAYATVLRILKARGIRHFDLGEPLRAERVPQESLANHDAVHPDDGAAEAFARYLKESGLLES